MIQLAITSKSWAIPEYMMEEDDGKKWLQISAAAYGLCNLLNTCHVGKNPSLKDSEGLVTLLAKRKKALDPSDVCDQEGEEVLSRKRKRSSSTSATFLELDLENHGKLVIKTPSRATEDLKIEYTTENVSVFCSYMLDVGCECTEPSRRKYKAAKKAET